MFDKIKFVISASVLLLVSTNSFSGGTELELLWETEGLSNPESVIYDNENNVLYVSNVNGAPNEKDGNGFISRISLSGEILDREWVTGLDAPKGLTIADDRLYVADIDTLVEIDISTASISQRYTASDAKFLNDVTADNKNNIYVSDMVLNRIYRLENGEFSSWLESEQLLNPNGLHVKNGNLIVGAWGVMTDGFATEIPGHLLSVNIQDKSIRSLGDGTAIGNLDGVEEDTDGSFYVTDWMKGKLFHITSSGHVDLLLVLEQGMADLEFLPETGILYIPMMLNNRLLAYKIN